MRKDYAGQTVMLNHDVWDSSVGVIPAGTEYRVEDYWDEVTGGSWKYAKGNFAALNYAVRSAVQNLPFDDEVLYGKIGPLGFIIHVSEIDEPA